MFGEIAYCDKAGCGERRIPTAASLFFSVLGSGAVCAAFLAPRAISSAGEFAHEPLVFTTTGSLLVMTVTATFAAYEKFRHPLLAFVFGVSLPGLLLGLAIIAADSAPSG